MSIEINNDTSRRKIIKWSGIGSIALIFSAFKISKLFTKKEAISCGNIVAKTTKMLTQDGQLVEIEITKISHQNKSRVTNEQLKNWIHKS